MAISKVLRNPCVEKEFSKIKDPTDKKLMLGYLIRYYLDMSFTDCQHYLRCAYLPEEKVFIGFLYGCGVNNLDEDSIAQQYDSMYEDCKIEIWLGIDHGAEEENDWVDSQRRRHKVYRLYVFPKTPSEVNSYVSSLLDLILVALGVIKPSLRGTRYDFLDSKTDIKKVLNKEYKPKFKE